MEKRVAIINSKAPIGASDARESLDLSLALSAYNESLSVFFIEDGVYQLFGKQQTEQVLQKNAQPMLAMLDLYDVENIYVCQASLDEREISIDQLVIDTVSLTREQINQQLALQAQIISF